MQAGVYTLIFVTTATGVRRRQVVMTPLNGQTPKTLFGTKIWELSPMEIELLQIRRLGGLNVVFGESVSSLLLIQPPNLIYGTENERSSAIDGMLLYQ